MQDAGARAGESLRGGETSGVFAKSIAAAACFDPHQLYIFVVQKFVEEADGVRAAADAGEEMRWQALFSGENLRVGLTADAGMKIADHSRIRMSAENGAKEIMSGSNVGDPVAHSFVDGVF